MSIRFDPFRSKYKVIAGHYFWRFVQIYSRQLFALIVFLFCIKFMDPKTFGVYNYILAIASLIIAFGDFGVSTAASKWVAGYNAREKHKVDLVPFNAAIIILVFTAVVLLVLSVFVRICPSEKYVYLPYVIPFIVMVPLVSMLDGVYRGLKRFRFLSLINMGVGFFSLGIIYFLISRKGLVGAILGQNFFYLMLLVTMIFCYRGIKLKFESSVIKDMSKDFFFVGFASLGYFLYTRVDVLILGQFNYIQEIAYYEVVNRTFMFFALPFSILGQVVAPDIASLATNGKIGEILFKFEKYFITVVPLSLLLSGIFLWFSPILIKKYLPAYYAPAMLIAISILSFLLFSKIWGAVISQGFLVSSGYAKIMTIFTIGGGILNIVFDYILIAAIGFQGVFWSTLIVHTAVIFGVTLYLYLALKKTRLTDVRQVPIVLNR